MQRFRRHIDGGGADGAVGRRRGGAGEGRRWRRVSGGAAAFGAGGAGVRGASAGPDARATGGDRCLGRVWGSAVAVRFHRTVEQSVDENGEKQRFFDFEGGGGTKLFCRCSGENRKSAT